MIEQTFPVRDLGATTCENGLRDFLFPKASCQFVAVQRQAESDNGCFEFGPKLGVLVARTRNPGFVASELGLCKSARGVGLFAGIAVEEADSIKHLAGAEQASGAEKKTILAQLPFNQDVIAFIEIWGLICSST